ncbi:MAG: hypothetical protein RL318_219 [Fibrobacterota bacterium]|jgi:NAD(P)H-dependent nitrite reductase small subunit
MNWTKVCTVSDVPAEGGIAVLLGDVQVALFHFASRGEWYAIDNACPHKGEHGGANVLARGILGDADGELKVTCPMHKRSYCLHDGRELCGEVGVQTWEVKIEGEDVFLGAA